MCGERKKKLYGVDIITLAIWCIFIFRCSSPVYISGCVSFQNHAVVWIAIWTVTHQSWQMTVLDVFHILLNTNDADNKMYQTATVVQRNNRIEIDSNVTSDDQRY